ncbi:MAG: acylneuraminate cytidylyltransferase [Anaerolineae bacterium]|nr:MAG: acylneuraminate cytidylyltransferase [Anaerolineae bacterium]
MNRIAFIQARRSSSRLPDKVLLDIGGKVMLQRVVERTRQAKRLDEVVVATTLAPEDEAIVQLCRKLGVAFARGNVFDVLDRFYQAALAFQAEVIVRITADCPLIDPNLIDQVIEAFFEWGELSAPSPPTPRPEGEGRKPSPLTPLPESHEGVPRWDFAANRLPPPWKRTYPIGLDVEVCTFQALERAWREATEPYHREHVMPYLYEEERSVHVSTLQLPPLIPAVPPGFFRVLRVDHDPDYGFYRWTVDTAEDLQFVRQVYAHFDNQDNFSWLEVLDLVGRYPELAKINAAVSHKSVHEIDERMNTQNPKLKT